MKRCLIALLLVSMLLSLAACGERIPAQNPAGGENTPPDHTVPTPPGGGTDDGGDETDDPFTVTVMLNGKVYVPTVSVTSDKALKVRWSDGKNSYTETVGEDGKASVTGLDGDYAVTLLNLPAKYTYNTNIYIASNDKRDVQIELMQLTTAVGNGTDLYSCKKILRTGAYRAEIRSAGQIVYYEFEPTRAGVYYVESMVDVSADMYNPILKVYTGTSGAKFEQDELDGGGASGNYTKNFRYKINVPEEYLGNIYTFAIRVEGKDAVYPVYVDFAISYAGTTDNIVDPDEELKIPEFIPSDITYFDKLILDTIAYDLLTEEEKNSSAYIWFHEYTAYLTANKNQFGSTWVDAAERVDGKKVFNEVGFKLNPDDGYYHVYHAEKYAATGGWGPILYADITRANIFSVDGTPLNLIEYAGNKALTVSNGTENYKLFVEGFHELTLRHGLSSGPYFCNDTCPCYKSYNEARLALLTAIEQYKAAATQGVDLASYANEIRACKHTFDQTNGGACADSCKDCNETCRHISEKNRHQMGYADIAVDGRVPVTDELKNFLQKFSESQRYFSDGNGWVESFGYTAFEDSQWLFACGYFTN